MKKILSLIMALTIIIASFAFVGTTVYADTSLYHEDNLGYTSSLFEVLEQYNGRSDVLYGLKDASATTTYYFGWKSRVAAYAASYQVYEMSLIFGENISNFHIKPGDGKGTKYYLESFRDVVNEGDWNDLKFIFKNEVGATGRTYLNGEFIGELNIDTAVSESDPKVRIRFGGSNSDPGVNLEVWIDKNSVKGTAKTLEITPDGHAFFNPDQASQNGGVLIVAAYNENGTVAKVNTKAVTDADTLVSDLNVAYNYKAFMFNSLTDIKPLVSSVSVK